MNKTLAIIFDFDGVILDSVGIKSDIFFEIFETFGTAIAKKAVKYHEKNGGISRFEKIKYINNKFLNSKLNKSDITLLKKKFSNLIKKKILKANYIKGSYEFISENYKVYEFHIATSTPENEILHILKKKKIIKFFNKIYGSPLKKTEQVKKILNDSIYEKNQFILIGDSIEDYQASINNSIRFIGVNSKYTKFPSIDKIDNLFQIKKYLI